MAETQANTFMQPSAVFHRRHVVGEMSKNNRAAVQCSCASCVLELCHMLHHAPDDDAALTAL